jgi:hypothetical protein
VGAPGSSFTFKVKYMGGQAATLVTLSLTRNAVPVAGSPFQMINESGSTDGVVFSHTVVLSEAGGTYSYRFRAYNELTELCSAPQWPAQPQAGPQAGAGGFLTWAGTSGYETDAVEPDSAAAGSDFTFQVKYTGSTAPSQVTLSLTRSGVPVAGSPFAMTTESGSTDTAAWLTRGPRSSVRCRKRGQNYKQAPPSAPQPH